MGLRLLPSHSFRQVYPRQPDHFPIADNPRVGPSCTKSAFVRTNPGDNCSGGTIVPICRSRTNDLGRCS